MTMPKNLGTILLAIWLILYGLLANTFLRVNFTHSPDILALFAIITAVVLLVNR
jgi:hypothetical protein